MTDEDILDDPNLERVAAPTDLRKKVRVMSPREAAKFDPVKAAEQALDRLSVQFDSWMGNEIVELADALKALKPDPANGELQATLFQAAHNIRGQGQTLGYPLVGQVAGSLCRLIDGLPSPDKLPLPLVEQHVEAIRAMVAEDARDGDNKIGTALFNKLADVTDDYLEQIGSA